MNPVFGYVNIRIHEYMYSNIRIYLNTVNSQLYAGGLRTNKFSLSDSLGNNFLVSSFNSIFICFHKSLFFIWHVFNEYLTYCTVPYMYSAYKDNLQFFKQMLVVYFLNKTEM